MVQITLFADFKIMIFICDEVYLYVPDWDYDKMSLKHTTTNSSTKYLVKNWAHVVLSGLEFLRLFEHFLNMCAKWKI